MLISGTEHPTFGKTQIYLPVMGAPEPDISAMRNSAARFSFSGYKNPLNVDSIIAVVGAPGEDISALLSAALPAAEIEIKNQRELCSRG
jgi:hypothetical protein